MNWLTKQARLSVAVAASMAVLLVLAACGGAEPTATPTTAPQPTPTATRPAAAPTATPRPTATPVPAPTAAPQATAPGRVPTGTLNVAIINLGSEQFVSRLSNTPEDALMHMISHPLMIPNPKDLTPLGIWVSEWSYQKLGTENVWTFKVRPGVVINEGWGTITAEDIKFNFAEVFKPDSRGRGENEKLLVDKDINNFHIVSPLEFAVHSTQFLSVTPEALGTVHASPWQVKNYSEKVGDEGFRNHPVGTGSFVFKSGTRGSKYTTEAVPNHWLRTSNVKTVNLLLVPEAATRLAMLKTGQADLSPLTTSYKRELTGNVRPISLPKQANMFMTLGGVYHDVPDKQGKDPWVGYTENARKVREAMITATDRQAMVDKVLYGEGELATAPTGAWPPGNFPWVDPAWKPLPYDPAKAKRLLTEAGYPNGFPIDISIFSVGTLDEIMDVAEAVAGYWEAIGLKVTRSPQIWNPNFFTRMINRETAGTSWVLWQGIPTQQLTTMRNNFTSQGRFVYITDPKIGEYVKVAAAEVNQVKRHKLTRDLGQHLIDERLIIPLFSINGVWGASSRLVSWDMWPGNTYLNSVETIVIRE